MLSEKEREELLADGFSIARREEFRKAERQSEEWVKKRRNRGCSIDKYLDFLEKFQEIIVPVNLSHHARQATLSRNLYRL